LAPYENPLPGFDGNAYDPRFGDNAARVANGEATDALVAARTRTLGKMEEFAIAEGHRIPLGRCATSTRSCATATCTSAAC
jgi:crotonobetainyl-CoA:carnitine CoA-transferase CaiB-like acyl-CoA transferase